MKRILTALFSAPLLCLTLAGCPTQNTTAALVGIAGTAIASLETIEGHTDAAAKIQVDFQAAQTAVLNWKAGTPTQDVAQALALVEHDLNLLPISTQNQAYIELAIGTVQSVLIIFQPAGTVTPHTAIAMPKTAAEFKAQWNSIGTLPVQLK